MVVVDILEKHVIMEFNVGIFFISVNFLNCELFFNSSMIYESS